MMYYSEETVVKYCFRVIIGESNLLLENYKSVSSRGTFCLSISGGAAGSRTRNKKMSNLLLKPFKPHGTD